jgi:hypothetical protein
MKLTQKKKTKKIINVPQNSVPKLNQDLKISPDVDRLIQEAEAYKKKSLLKSSSQQDDLIHNKNYIKESSDYKKTFETIKEEIIEELYSKVAKKVKKNTLKIIFDLRLQIKDLEKKLKNFQTDKDPSIYSVTSIDEDNVVIKYDKKRTLNEDVVKSLKIQDSSIALLNEKIKYYKLTEDKLLLQIIDLEQDNTILLSKEKKLEKFDNYKDNAIKTKEKLKSIYKKVENQKKVFLDLKKFSEKNKQEAFFFKENYEKLIIENNKIKNNLAIAKDQIVINETNKQDLMSSINQLNDIISKTGTVTNISSSKSVSKNFFIKKIKKD